MKDPIVIAYLVYLPIATGLTFFVARSLFRNSIVYMKDIFNGRDEIAIATNTLFRIGFYLLNLGFALYILRITAEVLTTQAAIEVLSLKIGGFCIYLGIMLFINMFLFFRGKKIARQRRASKEIYHPVANR